MFLAEQHPEGILSHHFATFCNIFIRRRNCGAENTLFQLVEAEWSNKAVKLEIGFSSEHSNDSMLTHI